jgi:hypothetical protein
MKIVSSSAVFALIVTIATPGISMSIPASTKTQIKPYGVCEDEYKNCLASGQSESVCEQLYIECLDQ